MTQETTRKPLEWSNVLNFIHTLYTGISHIIKAVEGPLYIMRLPVNWSIKRTVAFLEALLRSYEEKYEISY